MELCLYILGAVGLAIVVSMAKITEPLRKAFGPPIGIKGVALNDHGHPKDPELAILLVCPLCVGVWTGLLFGLAWRLRADPPSLLRCVGDVVAFAFASGLLAYFAGAILRRLDRS